MNKDIPVFGARAEVYLKYDGELTALADNLSANLVHVPFDIETRESPPYDVVGSCEALGFELWLEQVDRDEPRKYRLRFETEHCVEESFNDQMHDLSLWLARYISSICDVDTIV